MSKLREIIFYRRSYGRYFSTNPRRPCKYRRPPQRNGGRLTRPPWKTKSHALLWTELVCWFGKIPLYRMPKGLKCLISNYEGSLPSKRCKLKRCLQTCSVQTRCTCQSPFPCSTGVSGLVCCFELETSFLDRNVSDFRMLLECADSLLMIYVKHIKLA